MQRGGTIGGWIILYRIGFYLNFHLQSMMGLCLGGNIISARHAHGVGDIIRFGPKNSTRVALRKRKSTGGIQVPRQLVVVPVVGTLAMIDRVIVTPTAIREEPTHTTPAVAMAVVLLNMIQREIAM